MDDISTNGHQYFLRIPLRRWANATVEFIFLILVLVIETQGLITSQCTTSTELHP